MLSQSNETSNWAETNAVLILSYIYQANIGDGLAADGVVDKPPWLSDFLGDLDRPGVTEGIDRCEGNGDIHYQDIYIYMLALVCTSRKFVRTYNLPDFLGSLYLSPLGYFQNA